MCIYVEESFDTIFNMGYGSGNSPMAERVNKSPKIFALICFVQNAVYIPISHGKAVQDVIFSKTIRL